MERTQERHMATRHNRDSPPGNPPPLECRDWHKGHIADRQEIGAGMSALFIDTDMIGSATLHEVYLPDRLVR
jgi:hypothetical protein